MIVPAMNSRELLTEILKDFKIVERKAYYLASGLRREAVKSKSKYVQRKFDYRSPQRNKWLITIDFFVARPSFNAIAYYLDQHGLNGIRVNASLKSLTHLTPHFLDRYNDRFLHQPNLPKIELLKQFTSRNPLDVTMSDTYEDSKQNEITVRFNDGIGLGYKEVFNDIEKVIYHVKTFITNEMTFKSQEDDFNSLGESYTDFEKEVQKFNKRRA